VPGTNSDTTDDMQALIRPSTERFIALEKVNRFLNISARVAVFRALPLKETLCPSPHPFFNPFQAGAVAIQCTMEELGLHDY
jgi:hypothetical protein